MKLKKLIILSAAVTMLSTSTLGVSAAGLKDIFDAQYYADQYPDLKAAYGYNSDALYQHFIKYGIKEGRNMNPVLDVVTYRASYSDLDAAYGDNWDAYVNHFFTYGVNEPDRRGGVLLDPLEYAAAYPDVAKACGNNALAIAQHYEKYGIKENRTEGTANGYASIAIKDYVKAQETEEASRYDGEDARPIVVGKAKEYYNEAADIYIAYVNAKTKDEKNSAVLEYNDIMRKYDPFRVEIRSYGNDKEGEALDKIIATASKKVNSKCKDTISELPETLEIEE